ncbi:MAG: GEVED domain-containing protein, partial [Planctomycetota bacterium]
SFDTNARLGQQTTITAAPGNMLWEGQTFRISDGLGVLNFEFDDDASDGVNNNGRGNGVAAGHVAVPFRASQSANEIAEVIRDTINNAAVQSRLKITAALADGAQQGPLGTSSTVNLFGNAIVTLDPLTSLLTTRSNGDGDSNRVREQGQLIIESNTIRNSTGFGIIARAGDRDLAGLVPLAGVLPHAGPVRVTREVNSARLTPGVVITNNLVVNNQAGGIQFSGDPAGPGNQLASVAFGRIVNNTVVGRSAGTGIEIGPNASPTLLNNIVADFATGIAVDATSTSTVIGGTLYRGNAVNTVGSGIGSFPVMLTTEPLFVDELNGNYYLQSGSKAIDSSVDSLPDRTALTLVRGPLGFNPSPILAPRQDALGQTRVDDPSVVSSVPGQGSNVFKDRGAIDRADFAGPTPFLITPQDNDSLRQDADPQPTFIRLTNQALRNFEIQLLDGVEPSDPEDGTGALDSSVRADRLTLFRDGIQLVEGFDYKFTYDATNNIIRLTPLAGIWEAEHRYDIVLSNSRGFLLTAPDGSQVADGDSFNVADNFGNSVNFEFESGYVLQVPQTLALQIPTNAAALLTDRSTFTVTDSTTSKTVVFEFDLDGFVTPGNQQIRFTRSDSANEVAQSIVAAMQLADVGLSPVNHINFGGRAVHLGTRSGHTVDLTNLPLVATGQVVGIDDGQTFIVDDGSRRIVFEFTSTGSLTTGDRAIPFTFAQTNEQIAQSVATAIISAGLGLSPMYVALSDGLINVGGALRHFIDVSNSNLTLTGAPGVTPEFGLKIPTVAGQLDFSQIVDGEQFTITNGANSVTFELDNNNILVGATTNPLVVVNFTDNTTVDQLANAVAIAIRDANLGLSPANAGRGVINLLNATQQTIDLTNSSFMQRGTAGVASSIAVPFKAGTSFVAGTATRVPIDSAETIAAAITAAINGARTTGRLQGVFATQTGREVNLEGVPPIGGVTGLGTLTTSDIVDVAGNPLKANRADGTTQFTITIASGLDYGDAPTAALSGFASSYPTRLADDGARHQASLNFTLGNSATSLNIDADADGQPTVSADGDDNDGLDDENGVVFNTSLLGGFGGTITVTASQSGRLDAWIDFNQDGDWNDLDEQIFASRVLNSGANVLTVNVPGTALSGPTYARFRFSSAGALRPTGAAADGEVEDYRVSIAGNPWHNSANPLDVDGNGFVVPLDALIVINYINKNGTGVLPAVRGPEDGQVDTNGDGSATPLDVLLVVNALNNGGVPAEGEASVAMLSDGLQQASADALTELTTDVVIDQRIGVYDQRETKAQVQQAVRQATRLSANNVVFGSVDAFANATEDHVNSDRAQGEDPDELDALTLEQAWASGVDDLFGDWV